MSHAGPLPVGSPVGDTLATALEFLIEGISLVTAAVLAWGVLVGVVAFIRIESRRLRGLDCEEERVRLRKQVGFYLLFGLELLIAADVIETMVDPTLEHLAVLGGVALLRIVIGFALGREVADLERSVVASPQSGE